MIIDWDTVCDMVTFYTDFTWEGASGGGGVTSVDEVIMTPLTRLWFPI
jgi:hypothetical protein